MTVIVIELGPVPEPMKEQLMKWDYAGLIQYHPWVQLFDNLQAPETKSLILIADVLIVPATADESNDSGGKKIPQAKTINRIDMLIEALKLARRDVLLVSPSVGIDHLETCLRRLPKSKASVLSNQIISFEGSNAEAVISHTMQLALEIMRPVIKASAKVRQREHDNSEFNRSKIPKGKTWACIGRGKQAQELAKHLLGFGVKELIIYSSHMNESVFKEYLQAFDPSQYEIKSPCTARLKGPMKNQSLKIIGTHSLARAFENAHVISLHTNLTTETKNVINASTIRMMCDGVYIINMGRGGLVVDVDVVDNLISGKVAGYAADVINADAENFKDPDYCAIWRLHIRNTHNVEISPHSAGRDEDTLHELCIQLLETTLRRLQNKGGL